MILEKILGKYYADGVEISADTYQTYSDKMQNNMQNLCEVVKPAEGNILEEKIIALEQQVEILTKTLNQITQIMVENNNNLGTVIDPIVYYVGNNVIKNLYYTNGIEVRQAYLSGIPKDFNDRLYFDKLKHLIGGA